LFDKTANLEDLNTLRNLSELAVNKTIQETFKKKINELTVLDKGEAEIRDHIKISKCRPFVAKDQNYLVSKKSIFNKIIGDSGFELVFASFLDNCDDIISYVKNYFAVSFRLDYRTKDGDISNFYPDFIVKKSEKEIWIVETKGREDLDDPLKIERLKQWCEDINKKGEEAKFNYLYVKQEQYEKYTAKDFSSLIEIFQ
jgi:type III restriction enzyme